MRRATLSLALLVLAACSDGEKPTSPGGVHEGSAATPPATPDHAQSTPVAMNDAEVQTEAATEVPTQYHGRWSSVPGSCDLAGDSRLRIERNRVDFYESRGKVLGVRQLTPSSIEIDLESTGEGEVWVSTRTFRLIGEGQTLTDITISDHPVARKRCSE